MRLLRGIFISSVILVFCSPLYAQSENPNYDRALADTLGADEYGMKMYTFVILKTGPVIIEDEEKVGKLFRGHLDNIGRLVEEGKLIVAGPFMKNENSFRGLFILNIQNLEEARELLNTDPAIEAGLLEPELYQWYGSAALPMYLEASKKVSKKNP